jgi:predicted transcriptional regulator
MFPSGLTPKITDVVFANYVHNRGRLRYRALLDRQTYVDGEVRALVDRLFDGEMAKLAATIASRRSRIDAQ